MISDKGVVDLRWPCQAVIDGMTQSYDSDYSTVVQYVLFPVEYILLIVRSAGDLLPDQPEELSVTYISLQSILRLGPPCS